MDFTVFNIYNKWKKGIIGEYDLPNRYKKFKNKDKLTLIKNLIYIFGQKSVLEKLSIIILMVILIMTIIFYIVDLVSVKFDRDDWLISLVIIDFIVCIAFWIISDRCRENRFWSIKQKRDERYRKLKLEFEKEYKTKDQLERVCARIEEKSQKAYHDISNKKWY